MMKLLYRLKIRLKRCWFENMHSNYKRRAKRVMGPMCFPIILRLDLRKKHIYRQYLKGRSIQEVVEEELDQYLEDAKRKKEEIYNSRLTNSQRNEIKKTDEFLEKHKN